MRVLWIIINYNTPKEALTLIHTIPSEIQVVLVSNGTEKVSNLPKNVEQVERENKGYFAYWTFADERYDWIIYSNSDVTLKTKGILSVLLHSTADIVAPEIINHSGVHLNPKEYVAPSKRKMQFLRIIYKFDFSFLLYQKLGNISQAFNNKMPVEVPQNTSLFAPHGAVFIVRNNEELMSRLRLWDNFMFGEELYLGFHARNLRLRVSYDQRIKFMDIGSASLSHESIKKRRIWYYESIKYILQKFYI